MRTSRFRLKLRMELNRDEPGMFGNLDDLDERFVRALPRKRDAIPLKLVAVDVIEFVPMTMSSRDQLLAIARSRETCRIELARVCPKPHCATFVRDLPLFVQQADDWMRSVFVELRRMRIDEADDVASILDD